MLKKRDFEEILSNYRIGKYVRSKHIKHAFGNTVYFIWTTRGRYVLKVFEEDRPGFIDFQMKVMNYLSRKNLPVQNPNGQEPFLFGPGSIPRVGNTVFGFKGNNTELRIDANAQVLV